MVTWNLVLVTNAHEAGQTAKGDTSDYVLQFQADIYNLVRSTDDRTTCLTWS